MTSGYREDIDWLRAIAVLSVVAFHFEAPALYGGFVGVDIFFVISPSRAFPSLVWCWRPATRSRCSRWP
ncbi:hypothetical protein [Bradyrhizobium sp. ARR65]|uniref:hypothetical protein n=1 Tax=Bradyrhizobium sp. ARR65 TaxID=1040989 RepID=UPI000467C4EA|nr:hypothetical protein [Bradyrhizobium sp. ARR65]